jgi:uncharacterized membrane protein
MKIINEAYLEKEKFQLDRIAFFSDAIFAIAITLLIIEIRVPEIDSENLSDKTLFTASTQLIPKFIGFIISFFVIGLYWLAHHRMFKYITRSSQKLLWNNLIFMLPIVMMPFSTAFLSEYYNGVLRMPLTIYTINICMAGFFSYRLWRIIARPQNKLTNELNAVIFRYNATRALAIPIIFICMLLLSFVNILIAYLILPLTPLVSLLIKKYYLKKYPDIMATHLE